VTDSYTTETTSYNVNGQLAALNFSGGLTGGVQYTYSAMQNNGRITQAVDTISGEVIGYQYDALKRLTSANSTGGWAQAYQYDGFGNLTSKTLNGGSNLTPAVNTANNRVSSATYDLNGNMTSGVGATLAYDVANRMVSAQEVSGGIEYYGYAADNKRVYRKLPNGSEEITLYGAQGEKLGVYAPGSTGTSSVQVNGTAFGYPSYYYTTLPFTILSLTPLRSNVYFAGKMIWSDNVPAYQDRLGTNRANGAKFYPYGDEITSTSNDREKFATYTRDSYTGLDYANRRYFASSYGRFNTPDPYQAAAKGANNPKVPQSWNRYAYVQGDPVNAYDPRGLFLYYAGDGDGGDSGDEGDDGGDYGGGFGFTYSALPGTSGVVGTSTSTAQSPWDSLLPQCQQALATAMPNTSQAGMLAALNRATAAESTLTAATANTAITWQFLAAIGIRESGFQNITEVDGAGLGVGVFQISVPGSGLTAAQARNLTTGANYAAQLLNSNLNTLIANYPNLMSMQLLQATAASFNFGTGNISGNPNTIDVGTTGGNYGSNVLGLLNCFY
jgi:RHS repeat-associated protein